MTTSGSAIVKVLTNYDLFTYIVSFQSGIAYKNINSIDTICLKGNLSLLRAKLQDQDRESNSMYDPALRILPPPHSDKWFLQMDVIVGRRDGDEQLALLKFIDEYSTHKYKYNYSCLDTALAANNISCALYLINTHPDLIPLSLRVDKHTV